MSSWDKFQILLVNEIEKEIKEIMENNKDELSVVMGNHLFNMSGPTRLKRNLNQDQFFLSTVFYYFIEINNSYHALLDITAYLNSYPYRNKKTSKTRYLKYHIENYINEVYILKERLKTFFIKVERSYTKTKLHSLFQSIQENNMKYISNVLKRIIDSRGLHVHQSRFEDEDLERLSTFELLLNSNDIEFREKIRTIYDSETKRVRKDKVKIISQMNDVIHDMLDHCFTEITLNMFDQDTGRIKFPSKLKIRQNRVMKKN